MELRALLRPSRPLLLVTALVAVPGLALLVLVEVHSVAHCPLHVATDTCQPRSGFLWQVYPVETLVLAGSWVLSVYLFTTLAYRVIYQRLSEESSQ